MKGKERTGRRTRTTDALETGAEISQDTAKEDIQKRKTGDHTLN